MGRARVFGAVGIGLFLLSGSFGCATRGYVRSRIADLRAESNEAGSRLQAQVDQEGRLALSARSSADSAHARIGLVRELALGRTDFREVSRSSVYFALGRSALDERAGSVLDGVASQILRNPQFVVNLYGFSDPSGSENYNQVLARRRVDAVERYLVERTPGQLSRYRGISFGEQLPAAEVASMTRAADRRQVLVVLLERVAPDERPEALTERQTSR